MWDLLFGKPRKRYYKPKNKRTGNQNNKNIDSLKETKSLSDRINKEKVDVKKKSELNDISINHVISDNFKQKEVVDTKIYDNLVHLLTKEIDTVFLSAFLAETNNNQVIKSWFMKDSQSLILSDIFVKTNQFMFNRGDSIIKSYYILDLDEQKALFTLKVNSKQFALVLNSERVSVGYLINVIKPIIEKYIKNN